MHRKSAAFHVECEPLALGCDQVEIRRALNWSDVWMPRGIQHQWTYADVDGEQLFEVLRGVNDGKKEIC